MEQYRIDVNKQLREEMKDGKRFGFRKRISHMFYHFYMILFGELLCKEKYDRHVVAFEEFCRVDDERKQK